MSDLDKDRVLQDARRRSVDLARPTRYSEAITAYLTVSGYRAGQPAAPTARPVVAVTGVVMVGVDETPTSYLAVDHAAIEAELRGWDLRLVHVRHPGPVHQADPDAAARLLERLTERVHACSPSVAVTSGIRVGTAGSQLLADAYNANLVVVGHRHGPTGTAFGLSVADRVAAHHTGPVLVVRVPGWPPGPDFGRRPIVVGADGSATTSAAIRFSLEEARVRGCDLVMLHAGAGVVPADRVEDIDGVTVHHRSVGDDPATALVEASGQAAAVVVGRRGAGGFPAAMLGSVSRSLVQRAHCPVFLVG